MNRVTNIIVLCNRSDSFVELGKWKSIGKSLYLFLIFTYLRKNLQQNYLCDDTNTSLFKYQVLDFLKLCTKKFEESFIKGGAGNCLNV